jgi:multiple sugar transport system substrate-binding protein
MRPSFKRIFITGLALVLAGQGCTRAPSVDTQRASLPVTLNVWGVVDDFDVYRSAFDQYRALHPNVSFNYRRLRLEEYEAALLDALAEGRGPDVFMVHNTWTDEYLTKISSMPAQTTAAYRVQQGRNLVWEARTESSITLRQYRTDFADVVLADTIRNVNVSPAGQDPSIQERIVGMPVGVDTMALYYNKDLLNVAGVPTPPTHWGEFAEQVTRITRYDSDGNITQSAAGIGTANNVERASDLLTVLMMQNGTEMADQDGFPSFDQIPPALRNIREVPPAYQAVEFYTDFANPDKETYTWSGNMPNSLDAFVQGQIAYFFGYAYHYDQIRSRAPRLNLGIAPMPQIEGNPPKNIANYWYFAVSQRSGAQEVAWNFLNRLAEPELATPVLERAGRPAARKALLSGQLENERVGVFASQVLTAESWYRGRDPQAMEAAFANLINTVLEGSLPINRAVQFAVDTVAQTLR